MPPNSMACLPLVNNHLTLIFKSISLEGLFCSKRFHIHMHMCVCIRSQQSYAFVMNCFLSLKEKKWMMAIAVCTLNVGILYSSELVLTHFHSLYRKSNLPQQTRCHWIWLSAVLLVQNVVSNLRRIRTHRYSSVRTFTDDDGLKEC